MYASGVEEIDKFFQALGILTDEDQIVDRESGVGQG